MRTETMTMICAVYQLACMEDAIRARQIQLALLS